MIHSETLISRKVMDVETMAQLGYPALGGKKYFWATSNKSCRVWTREI